MKARYSILLLITGVSWFLVAGAFGYSIPVFGAMWIQHLICAILTSFAVGLTFRVPILRWTGWRWYALPLLTVFAGTAVFGVLMPCSWLLTESLQGGVGVDREAFYKLPCLIVLYSMTSCLVVLYPLALLTQHLLRSRMKIGSAEPDAPPSGDLAAGPGNSPVTEGPPSGRRLPRV
jgi:hypothetical protein